MSLPDNYPQHSSDQEHPADLHLLSDAQLNQLAVRQWVTQKGLPKALARICLHLNNRANNEGFVGERARLSGNSLLIPTFHRIDEGNPAINETLVRDTPAMRNLDDQLLDQPPSITGTFVGFHHEIDRTTAPPAGRILAQIAIGVLPGTRYSAPTKLLASCYVGDETMSLEFLDIERRDRGDMWRLFQRINRAAGQVPDLAGAVNSLELELFHNSETSVQAPQLQKIAKDVNLLVTNPLIRDDPELIDTTEELLRLHITLPQSLVIVTSHYQITKEGQGPIQRNLSQPKRFNGIEPDILVTSATEGSSTEVCFVAQTPDGVVRIPWQHVSQFRQQV